MPLETKIKFHTSVSMNTLLWGRDDWSGSMDGAIRIELFQNKVMCRVLGVTMDQATEEEVTNDEIRRIFGSVPKVEDAWRNRQLLFAGRIVRMKSSKHPKMLLTSTCAGKEIEEGHLEQSEIRLLMD